MLKYFLIEFKIQKFFEIVQFLLSDFHYLIENEYRPIIDR